MVCESDVTAVVAAREEVDRLRRRQQKLLQQILPQQVIDLLIERLETAVAKEGAHLCRKHEREEKEQGKEEEEEEEEHAEREDEEDAASEEDAVW